MLRDKLPEEIAKLCVSMTDLGRGGSAELEGGIKALSSRFASFAPDRQAKLIVEKRHQLHSARRATAELTDRIRSLRESETYIHPDIAAGYAGTLATIVQRLRREERECSWMPVPLPPGAPARPPVSVGEAAELVKLLATETPQRKARPAQHIPDVAMLPSPETLQGLITAEISAHDVAEQAQTGVSAKLEHLPLPLVELLERIAADVSRHLQELGLPENGAGWGGGNWTMRALSDGLAGRETAIWDQLAAHADRLTVAQNSVKALGFRTVVYPEADVAGGVISLLVGYARCCSPSPSRRSSSAWREYI